MLTTAEPTHQPSPPHAAAQLVDAHTPRDTRQPDPDRGPTVVARQRAVRAQVGLLSQVVSGFPVDEHRAEPSHICLSGPHQHGKGSSVAGSRPRRRALEVLSWHPTTLTAKSCGNQLDLPIDLDSVMCEQVRESLSAMLDGEPAPLSDAVVANHLAECAACAAWRTDVEAMQGRLRVGVAPVLTDETDRFVNAVHQAQPRWRNERRQLLPVRLALVVVAAVQLVLAEPTLLLGHDQLAPEHIAHELGAFTVAIAIGLLLAAIRPRLATGMVPIVGIVALLLVLTAWIDAVLGYTRLTEEAPHLLEVAGFVLLLRLAYVTNDRDWTPLLLPLRRDRAEPRRLASPTDPETPEEPTGAVGRVVNQTWASGA